MDKINKNYLLNVLLMILAIVPGIWFLIIDFQESTGFKDLEV